MDNIFIVECEEQINEEILPYINRRNSKPLDFDQTDETVYSKYNSKFGKYYLMTKTVWNGLKRIKINVF